MKKRVVIFLLLAMNLILMGCSEKEEKNEKESAIATDTAGDTNKKEGEKAYTEISDENNNEKVEETEKEYPIV